MAIYTCVLLDVDNTLLDFDAAERQAPDRYADRVRAAP